MVGNYLCSTDLTEQLKLFIISIMALKIFVLNCLKNRFFLLCKESIFMPTSNHVCIYLYTTQPSFVYR